MEIVIRPRSNRPVSAGMHGERSLTRWARPAAGVVLAALVVSGCSSVNDDAARVGDSHLSSGDFYDVLDGYTQATSSGLLPTGTIDAEVARSILLDWISTAALDQTLVEYGVAISESDLADAKAALDSQAGFADAPSVVQDFYIRSTAIRTLAGSTFGPDAESLADLYSAGPEESGLACLRFILTDTRAELDAAIARIEAGESFADIAAEVSVDPSSSDGGILQNNQTGDDCYGYDELVAQIYQEIADGIPGLRPGVIGKPIEVPDLGWIVLLLRPYSEVSGNAQKLIGPITASRLTTSALDNADVWVNPEFGRWDTETRRVSTGQ